MNSKQHSQGRNNRQMNWRLFGVTVLVVAVAVPALFVWHHYQLRHVCAAMQQHAEQLYRAGEYQKAADFFYRSFQLADRDAPVRKQLILRIAESYDLAAKSLRAKRTAIDWYQRAVGLVSGDRDAASRLAELYLETHQYESAADQAHNVLQQHGDANRARRILPLAHYHLLRTGRRLPSHRRLRRGTGTTREAETIQGVEDSGPAADTLYHLLAVFDNDPSDVELAEAIVDVVNNRLPQTKDLDRRRISLRVLDRLVAAASSDPRARLARYRYQTQIGNAKAARQDLLAARKLAPGNTEVLYQSAQDLADRAQYDQAVELYQRLIEAEPNKASSYLGLGEAQFQRGNRDEAIAVWRQGLSRAAQGRLPLHVSLIAGLIQTSRLNEADEQLNRLDKAITFLATQDGESQRDAIVAARKLLEARLRMAQAEFSQAVPLLQQVRDSGGASDGARQEAGMQLGNCWQKLQDWKKAALAFEDVLDVRPRSVAARLAAARAWIAEGSRYGEDEAIRLCSEVVAGPQPREDAWLLLAQLHFRQQVRRPPGQRSWRQLEQVLNDARAAMPDSWKIPWIQANLLILRDGHLARGQALQILVQQEQNHGQDISLWANLVFFYERLGLPREADRAMSRLAALSPNSARTLAWQVMLLANRGEFEAARRALGDASSKHSPQERNRDESDQLWLDRARAFLAYETGDLQQIRAALLQAVQRRPESVEVLSQLAELALCQRDWGQCDRWIQRLRDVQGPSGHWWRFFLARRQLDASGPSAEAEVSRLLGELQQSQPGWPGTLMLRGMWLEHQGDPVQSIDAYVDAIRAGFDQPVVYERLVKALYGQGRFEEANQWLLQLQNQRPLNDRLLDLASSAALNRDLAEWAVRLARDNVARQPQDPQPHLWLAQMLETAGEHEAAKEQVERAIERGIQRLNDWTSLLSFYLRTGDADAARSSLDKIQHHPQLSQGRWNVIAAQTYQDLGDFQQAEHHYRLAMQRFPDDVELRIRFAAFRRPFDSREAERELRRLVQQEPTCDKARRLLAVWLEQRLAGSSDEVTQLLDDEAAGRNVQQQVANQRLQAVLLAQRDTTKARDSSIRLLEEIVSGGRYVKSEDYLLLAQLYETDGDIRQASEQLRLLAEREEPLSRHLAVYAAFLLRHGRVDQATSYADRLERQAPKSVAAVELRARLLKANGKTDQIERYLEEYIQQRLADADQPKTRTAIMRHAVRLFNAVQQREGVGRWLRRLARQNVRYRDDYARFLAQNVDSSSVALSNSSSSDSRGPTADDRFGGNARFSTELPKTEVSLGDLASDAALLAKLYLYSTHDLTAAEKRSADRRLRQAVQQHPEDADLLFSAANFQLKFGDRRQAIRMFRQLTARHPQHLTGWNNLAAILADDPEQLQDAVQCIDRAIAEAGYPVANLLDTKAVILLRQDENQAAAAVLHQVLALPNGNDPRFHFHRSVALRKTGKTGLAEESWKTAKRLGLFDTYLTQFDQQMVRESSRIFDRQVSSEG